MSQQTADQLHLTITDSTGATRSTAVTGRVVVGREGTDLAVNDPSVSRRHLELNVSADGAWVADLGSSNGTLLNGVVLTESTYVGAGDRLLLGTSTIDVTAAPGPRPVRPAVFEPTPEGTASLTDETITVTYRPGSAGQRAAKSLLRAAVRARRDLAGFGSESTAGMVTINLVDPVPDPDVPGAFVTSGSFFDADVGQIWMVVTPEAPPEQAHRVLAVLFGAALPSADDVEVLVDGYALHLAGAADMTSTLEGRELPPLHAADGDLRLAMAVSFVRHLLEEESEDALRELLHAPAGAFESTASRLYGSSTTAMEADWSHGLRVGDPDVKTGEFLRMSLRYLKPYKLRQGEIFLYMLLSLAFTSAFPFVTQRLFDTAIPSGEFSQVMDLLIILAIAFVISLVAGLRQAYQSAYVSGAVVRDIRQEMFDRLQHIPTAWFGRYPQGDVLSRLFNDVGQVQAGLSDTIGQGIFQALSLVVSAVIMLTVNVLLGIIVLIGAPIVGIVYRTMAEGATKRSLAVQEDSSELFGVAAQNYRAGPVVRMFGLAGVEQERFRRSSDRLFASQRRLSLYGGFFGLSVNMIVTFLRLLILGLGAWLILEGRFTLGGLVAFLSIMGEVLSPVTVLTTLGQDIQASMGSLARINEVLDADLEPEGADLPELAPIQQEIRLTNLGFSYTQERRALDAIDAVIPAGTKVAFVGPSGSGKSTVLKMLMRMYEPDEGGISIDGVDLRERNLTSLRDQTGVVFQDSFLFDTTLRENIALGKPGATEDEIMAAADAAEIDAFLDNLPRGLDTLVGEGGGNLSGGQRQRVAIARALVRNPRILLLDEATSALDPQTERQISATLDRVAEGRTVVSITHRLTSIVDYDRIFVVVDGRLEEQGTHEELVAEGGVYARLWAEQTGGVVPTEAPFDGVAALASVSLFRDLDDDALARVASRLQAVDIAAGERIPSGEGRLCVLARGRAQLLSPAANGELTVTAQLDPGDAFGLTALLGGTDDTVLAALEAAQVLVLDDEAIQAIAAEHPSVAAQLGGAAPVRAPVKGKRIERATIAHGALTTVAPEGAAATTPSDDDVRRMTGTFPRVNG